MERINFNDKWTFYKDVNNSSEKAVYLPHDAMMKEKRDSNSPGGSALAFFPGGVYFYKKSFKIPEEWQQKTIAFEFGGIYENSSIYINGNNAGGRPYGYSRFIINADPYLKYGEENTIRVVADNSKQPNSRWYSGSGIFRPVHLLLANKSHIAWDGIRVTTLSYQPAKILVETDAAKGKVIVEILDGDKIVADGEGKSVELLIKEAKLWSAESPNLYKCRISLIKNGSIVDRVAESFGICKVDWSKQGLFINGKETLLRGGCIHHDNGILGSAGYQKAEERRIRIMKKAGFNAIRCAHNPPSIALLDACDRFGMFVINESFDTWYIPKNKYDYSQYFEDWYQDDLRAMVAQSYNHPSVIMYSLGNELSEPIDERGLNLTREMVDLIHELDPIRAVTAGINLVVIYLASKGVGLFKEDSEKETDVSEKKDQDLSGSAFFNMLMSVVGPILNKLANTKRTDRLTDPFFKNLDIAGYNYTPGRYKLDGKRHPDRVILGSETFPKNIAKNWGLVKRYPYVIGDFMWTGWDYLGEAGVGAWAYEDISGGITKRYPWLLSGSGVIDILGNIGAQAEYAAIIWGLIKTPYICVRPVNHSGERVNKSRWRGTDAIDSWSWKDCEGKKAVIEVYANAHTVELFLNEEKIGKKRIKDYKAMFRKKYQPGTLRAIAFDHNGQKISESELVSAFGKTQISLKPEDTEVKSGDIVYFNVELVGENGVVESNDDRKLSVSVENGTLLGFGSANPKTEERFDSGSYTTYYGKALGVARSKSAGEMTFRVNGENLAPVEVNVSVKD